MEAIRFFTNMYPAWLNAWIPSVALLVIQFVFMGVFKEGGRRAVDTSWYDEQTKAYALSSAVFQILMIVVSVFVPLKIGTVWFLLGTILYVISFVLFVWSFFSYTRAEKNMLITKGIYRFSRNPMYAAYTLGMLGVCVASASIWLLLTLIPFVYVMHGVILGEERYCKKIYGDDFLEYKRRVPRYFF